jgi:hypothetical protein
VRTPHHAHIGAKQKDRKAVLKRRKSFAGWSPARMALSITLYPTLAGSERILSTVLETMLKQRYAA